MGCYLIYQIVPPDPNGPGRREGGPGAGVLVVGTVLGILLAIFAGLYGLLHLRSRKVVAILRKASEGGADGAIEAVRAEIAAKGTTANRANLLGCLLLGQDRWEEGDEQFLEAIRLKGRKPPQLTNHAVAIWKLGRTEEAATIFEEVAAAGPLALGIACTYCLILADLGRNDEARASWGAAETLAGDLSGYLPESRPIILEELERCRARVLGLEGVKKGDLTGLDEL